jgi:pectate lyase
MIRGGISAAADNVVFQHFRIRPGEEVDDPHAVEAIDLEDAQDNVIVDHMTCGWATDNIISHKEGAQNITHSNNMFVEGLCGSDHGQDEHCYGMNSDPGNTISGFGNLIMSNRRRNPRIHEDSEWIWVNNFGYNTTRYAAAATNSPSGNPVVTFVGNHYEYGDRWHSDLDDPYFRRKVEIYFEDNLSTPEPRDQLLHEDAIELDEPPFMPDFNPLPANEIREFVLSSCGARPADVDSNGDRVRPEDQRPIDWAHEGGGHPIVNYVDDVEGYPDYDDVERELDVPDDQSQIPDWLDQFTHAVEVGDSEDQ